MPPKFDPSAVVEVYVRATGMAQLADDQSDTTHITFCTVLAKA